MRCASAVAAHGARSLSRACGNLRHVGHHHPWGTGKLKETELITRLGQAGKKLRLLARGEAPHLFRRIEPSFALEERMELDSPVELLDSLLFILGVMLDQLIVRAQSHILALASITLQLDLEGHSAYPDRAARTAQQRSEAMAEAHPPGSAGASAAGGDLVAQLERKPGSTSKVQLGLFSPQAPEPMRLDVTLARIRSIVGEGCVGRRY